MADSTAIPDPAAEARHRRCGECNRCLSGTGREPVREDCYAAWLDRATADLERTLLGGAGPL